jgi:alkylated DNA repair dioxygenase AlkB
VSQQLDLLASGEVGVTTGVVIERLRLDARCWLDLGLGWLGGADRLYVEMEAALPWKQRSRLIWGERVLEPRLGASVPIDELPAVGEIADALSDRYAQPLRTCWANWYRDGDDAVAWHGDRIGRSHVEPLVAIVSLGGPRRFMVRPKGGGSSQRHDLHSGDLIVMGGAMQHLWEHCVPRQRGAAGRMSLTFRAAES